MVFAACQPSYHMRQERGGRWALRAVLSVPVPAVTLQQIIDDDLATARTMLDQLDQAEANILFLQQCAHALLKKADESAACPSQ
ncbi:hypothetical protein [Nonomuraea ceibae]|uniref:hypothetical protein n=1 Tax=Nonomuraea ceibae TaxID=1935170 RepID=UPI001C5FAC65|nr:hypothetical protein [Nonomuraea ceibae]